MNNYNEQYYILFNDFSDGPSYLRPLTKTSFRNYEYEKLNLSGGPAFFENAFEEEDKKAGEKHPIYDVMDAAGWYLFSHRIYEKMQTFVINNFQFFPSVFIDDDGHYHENYVLTNFYGKLDCLDVKKSIITSQTEIRRIEYEVEKIYLSTEILDNIPEEERLIFKIDKVGDAHIMVHQKIKDIMENENATGAKFIRVDQYTEGDEYD